MTSYPHLHDSLGLQVNERVLGLGAYPLSESNFMKMIIGCQHQIGTMVFVVGLKKTGSCGNFEKDKGIYLIHWEIG